MILIAAIATGFALVREFLSATLAMPFVDRDWFWQRWERFFSLTILMMPITLALTALGYIDHRREINRAPKTAGFNACSLVSITLLAFCVHAWVRYLADETPRGMRKAFWRLGYWEPFIYWFPIAAGFSVAFVWLLSLGIGVWRAENSWIDRCARIVGVCWIILSLLTYAIPTLNTWILLSRARR